MIILETCVDICSSLSWLSGFHRVRLEVAGEKLRLLVDDKPAFDFTDGNLLANGGFGLFITSDVASPSTVQIANLRIYAVE